MKIIVTGDGSHTIGLKDTGECYHSIHGAIQESRHVFIQSGFLTVPRSESPINILEVGFGTGLNALLTACQGHDLPTIQYTAIEPHPISNEIWDRLNYAPHSSSAKNIFRKLHECNWNEWQSITSNFRFLKRRETIQDCDLDASYHLVYFDAFSPKLQPELWSSTLFSKLNRAMAPGGILVTYCAKGSVKQALRDAGFEVNRIAGPPGKRHMVRAVKKKTGPPCGDRSTRVAN